MKRQTQRGENENNNNNHSLCLCAPYGSWIWVVLTLLILRQLNNKMHARHTFMCAPECSCDMSKMPAIDVSDALALTHTCTPTTRQLPFVFDRGISITLQQIWRKLIVSLSHRHSVHGDRQCILCIHNVHAYGAQPNKSVFTWNANKLLTKHAWFHSFCRTGKNMCNDKRDRCSSKERE